MKVLFVTNLPTPYRVDFFSELSKYCELTVFFEAKRSKNLTFNWNDDKVLPFNLLFFNEFLNESRIIITLIKKVIFGDFNKIVICSYHTRTQTLLILLLKLINKSYYFETDGGIIPTKESKIKSKIKTFLISGSKGYFSPSKESDEYLIKYGAKKNSIARYSFTSLSVNDVIEKIPSKEQKSKIKETLGVPYDKIIVSVGQFIHRKGFDVLLESCPFFSDAVGVYIIGGKPTAEYNQIINRLKIKNVNFVEFLSKKQLDNWFLAADLFVLPTREDIWGLVINEAMSKGLPVITTNRCLAGLELILDSECLCPIEDSESLGRVINKVLDDDVFSNKLSANNLKMIRKRTFENMAMEHMTKFSKND
ncbi:MAG: glycosyltransferase family 4 protein [Algibacter sp.]|uniref:glycosyltransferase family 4 protein n=1 Tax=Algibacter sp. TaxID=1872428 RepID=UPI003297705D